jgi:hypothetical protein
VGFDLQRSGVGGQFLREGGLQVEGVVLAVGGLGWGGLGDVLAVLGALADALSHKGISIIIDGTANSH